MISDRIGDPDLLLIKHRYTRLKKHYEELNRIRKAEKKYEATNKTVVVRAKGVNCTEKLSEINRVNKILLAKIQDIGLRKPEGRVANKSVKTLNMPMRKQNAAKISEENEQIFLRILSSKPLILKEKFEKDFVLHQKYKNQLSKKRLFKCQENYWGKIEKDLKSLTPTFVEETYKKSHKAFYRSGNLKESSQTPPINSLTYPQELAQDSSYEYSDDFHS